MLSRSSCVTGNTHPFAYMCQSQYIKTINNSDNNIQGQISDTSSMLPFDELSCRELLIMTLMLGIILALWRQLGYKIKGKSKILK